jgi:hypothetical protein
VSRIAKLPNGGNSTTAKATPAMMAAKIPDRSPKMSYRNHRQKKH